MLADMHTHSRYSHDSDCAIEEMRRGQEVRGTALFAVTDHIDTSRFQEADGYARLQESYQTVQQLNRERTSSQPEILFGIELGEAFWRPEIYHRIHMLLPYDVVIGSVHLVRGYTPVDFSLLSNEEIEGYLQAYFNDMLTMLETVDIDILAHLTYPLRYINGHCHRGVTLSRFDDVITQILTTIIEKGIALEVNTSSWGLLHTTMPSTDILKNYYTLGGRRITLGSDAHHPQNASAHFGEAIDTLKDMGFTNTYFYKQREPIRIDWE